MRRFLLIFFLLSISYFLLYKIYIPRVSAFGCFDDCFNFAAGYFINHHKVLYSEIFYNHQMLPAYISSVIQSVTHPINIFELVLKHRQFLLFFSFIFNLLLITRFGTPAFLFFIFFEFSKFYIFGDRFLAEGILAYPLVYLIFLAWQKLKKNKIEDYDYILLAISAWLVLFLRETFIPVTLVLFLFILFPYRRTTTIKKASILLFTLLCLASLLSVNIGDYYFNEVVVNKSFFADAPSGFLKILFYPLYILTSDKWNLFRIVLSGIDAIFLFSLSYLVVIKKRLKFLIIFVPLILANLRVVEPGELFYSSFHMIPFFAIFLSLTFLLIWEVKKYSRKIWMAGVVISTILFIFYISSPKTFFRDKIKQHDEFIINYGNILEAGDVIKTISNPTDTLFVDGFDEMIYWVADRPSSYKYLMYTSSMPNFKKYSDAREGMFTKTPPDFYYGSCYKEINAARLMPSQSASLYTRLNAFGKPSCVFVRKDKVKNITTDQWKKAKERGYDIS